MFARFRQTAYRLQVSLVATCRVGGRVNDEHIATLGSIGTPQTVAGRVAFWQRLHDRLAKLGNRIDAEQQAKLMGTIHARIPMATVDEIRTLQTETAQSDERFWFSSVRARAAWHRVCERPRRQR